MRAMRVEGGVHTMQPLADAYVQVKNELGEPIKYYISIGNEGNQDRVA